MPDVEGLTKQAAQRLEAIQNMEELGSGFYLAMHDLEIRGAGEVLGDNQSGNMMEVGFQLYNEMLSEAVRSLKAGREPDLLSPLSATTEINLHAPALLPNDYCGDVHTRLSLLQAPRPRPRKPTRSTRCSRRSPTASASCRRRARPCSTCTACACSPSPTACVKIDAAPAPMVLNFKPNPPIDAIRIIELVQKNRHIKLAGNDKLRIERETKDPKDRAQLIRDVLRQLGQPKAEA